MTLLLELLAMGVLFVLSAFFSSSESALFSLDPLKIHKIREKHPRAAERIERALSRPTRLLSAILVGNTLVNVVVAGLGYAILEDLLPARGITVAIPTMTALLLVFGEISPKRLALQRPEMLSVLYAAPLDFYTRLMTPAIHALAWIAKLLERWLTPVARLTEGEFRTALADSEEHGVLDVEERSIVDGIISLKGLSAGDVMTPRVDLVAVDEGDPIAETTAIVRKARFKFVPVYKETPDHILGFLDVRRFLLAGTEDMKDALIPPLFVPLSAPLNKLMRTLQAQDRRAVCVVDEFGGTAGIVTQGDVMEEIIEESPAGEGVDRVGIHDLGERRWRVGGDTSLEEINEELDLNLLAESASRIGGWVSESLERIPRRGDMIRIDDARVTVAAVRFRRVSSVIIEKTSGLN